MGMYTGVRFKGYIKPEFRESFEDIALYGEWENSFNEVFSTYGRNNSRVSFIPCGALSYMPDEWEIKLTEYIYTATNGFNRTWDKETGYWTFQCSLKNYEETIEEWLKILPYFIEKIEHLEVYYEEWEYSKQYNIINGKIELVNEKFIRYIK